MVRSECVRGRRWFGLLHESGFDESFACRGCSGVSLVKPGGESRPTFPLTASTRGTLFPFLCYGTFYSTLAVGVLN
jgi:hypothetical protein